MLSCPTETAFHLVAEEPNVELENGRLLAIDLDTPDNGTTVVRKSDVSTYGHFDVKIVLAPLLLR